MRGTQSGLGGALRLLPYHTTVRTGPYTAVRFVKRVPLSGHARRPASPRSDWAVRSSAPGCGSDATGHGNWRRFAPPGLFPRLVWSVPQTGAGLVASGAVRRNAGVV